jgi:hypothetical protein
MKTCSKCGIEKPLEEFYRNTTARGGFQSWCRECGHSYNVIHREESAARSRAYYVANREKVREQHRVNNASNPGKARDRRHAYREAHPEYRGQQKAWNRAYRLANPRKLKVANLKRVYGLSEGEYLELLTSQQGKCAICGERMLKPCVDHDHAIKELTGVIKIRGLLCHHCNTMLGMSKDSVERLASAIRYLDKA